MKRNNKKGFSLVEVMISLGILGITSLSVVVIYDMINKNKVAINEKISMTEFVSALSKSLTSQQSCEAILTGISIPTTAETEFSINNYNGYGSPANKTLTKNTPLSNNLKITSFTIKDKGGTTSTVDIGGVVFKKIIAEIHIKFDLIIDNQTQQYNRYIDFPIVSKGTTIDKCFIEEDTSNVCTSIGGTFTPPNSCNLPTGQCQFRGMSYGCVGSTCPGLNMPSARGFALGSGQQSTPPTGSACPRGGTPTSTGQYSYTICTGSGKSLRCNSYTAYFYICLDCT